MTIAADKYFAQWRADRKKEPRYLAAIDKVLTFLFQDYSKVFLD